MFIIKIIDSRPAYYKLIEECVSQIVLHRSGCDPDFSATKRFQIDVGPLIETLVEKSRAEEDPRFVEMSQKLEEAIAKKQEAEAKLQHAETVIRELEHGTGRSGSGLPVIYSEKFLISRGCTKKECKPGRDRSKRGGEFRLLAQIYDEYRTTRPPWFIYPS